MIGFMQGRLTKSVSGKLQFFPWGNWENEFKIAFDNKIKLIEWTIDSYKIDSNPIFSQTKLILKNSKKYNVQIKSVTCDFIMESPFYKKNNFLDSLFYLKKTLNSCDKLGIKYVIFPLVDNGKIENEEDENYLVKLLNNLYELKNSNCSILFETDFNPQKNKKFIERFDVNFFGINYDTGNSASSGFDVKEEFDSYSKYIKNIHIKDRKFRSDSVKLGSGDFDFQTFFSLIHKVSYNNNFILQTARHKSMSDIENINYGINFIKKYNEY